MFSVQSVPTIENIKYINFVNEKNRNVYYYRLGEPFLMVVKAKEGEVLIGNARYKGYTKDLMDGIANLLNFTYELFLTPDEKYGNYDENKKAWNGLIGDIIRKVNCL